MPERKSGLVRGFIKCNDDYLKLIADDLRIDSGFPLLKLLQKIYAKEGKDPTVTQLLFDCAYMKNSCRYYDSELIADAKSDSPSATELFSMLSVKAAGTASRRNAGLSACALAEFACQTESEYEDGTYSLFEKDYPEFKRIPGSESAFFEAGNVILRHERGKKRSSLFSANDSGILVYPGRGQTNEEYWKNAEEFARRAMDEDLSISLIPMTSDGLLKDVCNGYSGAAIFVNELPGCPLNPEAVLETYCPGFILKVSHERTAALCSLGASYGLFVSAAIGATDKDGTYRIYSSREPVLLTPSHMENARLFRRNSIEIRREGLDGKGTLDVYSCSESEISATELSGLSYEALAAAMKPMGQYCVFGTLNIREPAAADFILSLYSFVKDNNVRIRASRFVPGKKTSVILFTLGDTNTGKPTFKAYPDFISDKYYVTSEQNRETSNSVIKPAAASASSSVKGRIAENLADLCGNTPMLRLYPELGAKIYAKLEMFNPAGSAKDRVALEIIRSAEESGQLRKGGTIIEATSGNTGIGLAAYGVARGYKVIIIMPDTMSAERISLIRAYGADVRLTPGSEGMSGANALAEKLLCETEGAFAARQFSNPSNPKAHEKTTGPEIWRDLEGKVDYLVAGVGTGGTLCGSAAYLKRMNPDIKIIACEPASSPLLSGGNAGPHKIQGIGANFIPDNYDASLVDAVISVSDEEAIAETVNIARMTGLLCGISSGCAVSAARKIASYKGNEGKTIAVILPDTGEHYLSCGIFG